MFRDGLRLLIARELPNAQIVGEAASAASALQLVRSAQPDLIIMDLHLPDGNGLDASSDILVERPGTRIVVLSAETDLSFVQRALRIGVLGYLLKTNASAVLPDAVRNVLMGYLYLSPEVSRVALEDYRQSLATSSQPKTTATLSSRELQVLHMIADGLRTKEIADSLNVGVRTAETYRKRLIHKLGCKGTADLIRHAIREGLVPP
jgi:DNA-binding NarL/FixJ family response regulator